MTEHPKESSGIGDKLIRGTAWMLAMRWLSRLMGLASMIVVARLLVPADFGIFAVATAIIGLLDAFTDIGTDIAVIRHPDPKRHHYDTAWTFRIILHGIAACLIALCAPLAVEIYDDARYESILHVLALSMLVSGFANIGVANFRRRLQFHKDFQYQVLIQLAGVLTTLVLAYLLRSYWALVLGGLARSISGAFLSYLMHDYRPRLSLAARGEIFEFSSWVMVRSVALFLIGSADRLVLGAFYAPTLIGWYTVAGTLAAMAVFELLHPIGRALLPGLAAKQGDQEWESRNLKTIFAGTAAIAVAAGLGLSALATPVVTLIYGEQFAGAGPMLALLAITAAVSGLSQPVGQFLMVLGRVRELAIIFSLEGVVSLGVTYIMARHGADLQTIIYARLAVAVLALSRVFYFLHAVSVIGWRDIAFAWLRPGIAGVTMYAALWGVQRSLSLSPAAGVILGGIVGAFVFAATLLAVWHMMKRPLGIESELILRINKFRITRK